MIHIFTEDSAFYATVKIWVTEFKRSRNSTEDQP